MERKYIKSICYISIFLFTLLLLFGLEIPDALGYAASGATILGIVYDRWGWKYNPFEKTPRIAGHYVAVRESSYNGGRTYRSEITIRQTLSSIYVREIAKGGESGRSIVACFVTPHNLDDWKFCYTYESRIQLTGIDKKHEGTVIIDNFEKHQMTGYYFTNRIDQTCGKITLIRSESKPVIRFPHHF